MLFYSVDALLPCGGEADDTSPLVTAEGTIRHFLLRNTFLLPRVLPPSCRRQIPPIRIPPPTCFLLLTGCSGIRVWKISRGSHLRACQPNQTAPRQTPGLTAAPLTALCLCCGYTDGKVKAKEAPSKRTTAEKVFFKIKQR